jgi:hypothetical protein
MSLNGIKKEWQIPGKGQNETLEIVNPVEHTKTANVIIRSHMSENAGTCTSHDFQARDPV